MSQGLSLLLEVDAVRAKLEEVRPLSGEAEARAWKKFQLDWNFHSNALEGNSLTLGETEAFLRHGLTAKGKPFKDYLDIQGHDQAIEFLKKIAKADEPFTEVDLRNLHGMLLKEPYFVDAVTPDGFPIRKLIRLGEYKREPNSVRLPNNIIHHYASPEETPARMGELMDWWRKASTAGKEHPVLIATLLHHRFTEIHPFDDGNGRMARLLMNLHLMRAGFPPAVILRSQRNEYLLALSKADQKEPEDLVVLIAERVISAMKTLVDAAKGLSIEELGDLDKEVALLVQKYSTMADYPCLSPETLNQTWDEHLEKQMESFFERLEKIASLYSSAKVQPSTYKSGDSAFDISRPKIVLEYMAMRFSQQVVGQGIGMKFSLSTFRRTQLGFDDSFDIAFKFEKQFFKLICGDRSVTSHYSASYDSEVVAAFLDQVIQDRMAHIQKNTQSESTN